MHTEEKCHLLSRWAGVVSLFAAATCLFVYPAQAVDESKLTVAFSDTKATADASGPLTTLRKSADAVDAAYAAYEKATDRDQNEKLWTAYTQTNDSLVPKIMDGVRESPTAPEAFGLLEWVVTNGRTAERSLRPCYCQAIEILRDHYTTHTNISRICWKMGFNGDPLSEQPAVEFLQMASTNNPERAARAYASYALALLAKEKSEEITYSRTLRASIYTNAPNAARQKARAAYLEKTRGQNPDAILHQAEQLFQTVKTDYSDVPNFSPGPGIRKPEPTLGEQASIELYECQHLTVGRPAPEIEGEDLDGHKLRLSDYRGKVVIISFWASWCGPCMQMVPHEAAIAQRLAGKPFVLLGVNADSGKTEAKRAAAESKMTWQSFWNGGSSEGGIAGAWNVHSWPTVYVLDSNGTIRAKFDGYDALLDAEVDQLLQEAEKNEGSKI